MSRNIPSHGRPTLTLHLWTKEILAFEKDSWSLLSKIRDLRREFTQFLVLNWFLFTLYQFEKGIADASFCVTNVWKQQLYGCQAKLIIEILWRWHNLLEKMIKNCIIYHTSNITELSNGRRQLTATFAKCNLHKWNTLYTYYNFTQCAIIFCLWETFEETLSNFRYITEQLFLLHLTFY